MFVEYGDDSVAQLGGVHLACEQASNLLTKVLEWGRLMSYLEQSTRYIAYDARLGGRYRYYRDPPILGSPLGTRYVGDMDRLFDTYAELVDSRHRARPGHRAAKQPADSDFVYRQATRAKALDAVRGVLPAASLSNVGIYGTGQAFEALLLRMRSHPLPEARALRRADAPRAAQGDPELPAPGRPARPGRGAGATTWPTPVTPRPTLVERLFGGTTPEPVPAVVLTDWDPDAEDKLLAAICYPHTDLPEHQVLAPGSASSAPTIAWPSCGPTWGSGTTGATSPAGPSSGSTTASTSSPTTAPSATCSATACSPSSGSRSRPRHGYVRPSRVEAAGQADRLRRGHGPLGRPLRRHRRAVPRRPGRLRRGDGLPGALRRCSSTPARPSTCWSCAPRRQGHPAYRRICLEMHRLIAEQAGHRAVAEAMSHVDHTEPELARLEGERRAEVRRLGR